MTLDDVGLTSGVFLLDGNLGSVGLDASWVSLACPGLGSLLPKQRPRTLHNLLLLHLKPIPMLTRNKPPLLKPRHISWYFNRSSPVHHQVCRGGVDLVLLRATCGGIFACVHVTVVFHLLLLLGCSELVAANFSLVLLGVHLCLRRLHIKEGSNLLTRAAAITDIVLFGPCPKVPRAHDLVVILLDLVVLILYLTPGTGALVAFGHFFLDVRLLHEFVAVRALPTRPLRAPKPYPLHLLMLLDVVVIWGCERSVFFDGQRLSRIEIGLLSSILVRLYLVLG